MTLSISSMMKNNIIERKTSTLTWLKLPLFAGAIIKSPCGKTETLCEFLWCAWSKKNRLWKSTLNNYTSWYTLFLGPGSKLSTNLVARDRVGKRLWFKDTGSISGTSSSNPIAKVVETYSYPPSLRRAVWRRQCNGSLRQTPSFSMRRVAKQTTVGKNYSEG